MTDERWDVPDERLAQIASRPESPQLRDCAHCKHRHARGEMCGYPIAGADVVTCRCRQ